MKNGFTLIELSIVLVIIGLLIGGILVGQSLVESAKINGTISQIQQFDAGVMAFKSKYKYLPGDAPAFGGDGDGIISLGFGSGGAPWRYATNVFQGEIYCFWSTIDLKQFPSYGLACNLGGGAQYNKWTNVKGGNKNVPESKLGSAGAFFIASALSSGQSAITINPANCYTILSGSQVKTPGINNDGWPGFASTTSNNSAVKPTEALALDQKMDDGFANAGNVLSGRITGGGNNGAVNAGGLTTCSSGANYVVSNSGYECTPLIRIGSQAGSSQ